MNYVRGTRSIYDDDAELMSEVISRLSYIAECNGFSRIYLPSLAPQSLFIDKAGEEILNQMYTFPDKKGRDLCLIPEATEVCRAIAAKDNIKPQWYYIEKCYRYERPQAGRYREFYQFGIEDFTGEVDVVSLLEEMLCFLPEYEMHDSVKRGLDYYIGNGFEATCDKLGAQKQIAGGGTYEGGQGFAIGLDRLCLALKQ
jgi:histidyl-tRNA synthetase